MAGGFTVTTAQMRQTATELTQLNGQYQQQVGRLMENEEELDAMWDGEANEVFKTAFMKSYESLNSFYTVMAEYIAALQQIAQTYDLTEQQAAQIAKGC